MAEMTNLGLLEEVEKEGLEELKRRNYDDPARKSIMAEVKTCSDIRVANAEVEINRVNNNAKNSIEEERIMIEREKVKTDRKRGKTELIKAGIYFFGGAALSVTSYFMEVAFQRYPQMSRYADKLHDMVVKK